MRGKQAGKRKPDTKRNQRGKKNVAEEKKEEEEPHERDRTFHKMRLEKKQRVRGTKIAQRRKGAHTSGYTPKSAKGGAGGAHVF